MRAFTNYNNVQEFTDKVKLPAGAYEIEISRAEEQDNALCLLFDISDGDFRGYYREKFFAEKKYNEATAKFKGVYRLYYPDGKDIKKDENKERRMKTALEKIKESNNLNVDFTKEWDGAILKGCKVGIIMQDKEWSCNGRTGMTAQPYGLITLDDLKAGKYKVPDPYYISGQTPASTTGTSGFEVIEDDDLPF